MNEILTVLIVEDSAEDAQLLVRELQRGGFQVTYERVQTGESLKRALERRGWDLVFCDYTLPQFSGREALALVKAAQPELPFIYVSGTLGPEAAVEAINAGAQDYFPKGHLERLVVAVRSELAAARRSWRSSEAEYVQFRDAPRAQTQRERSAEPVCICTGCRRLREARGEWQPVELFLSRLIEARFEYELYPECAHRQVEDEVWITYRLSEL